MKNRITSAAGVSAGFVWEMLRWAWPWGIGAVGVGFALLLLLDTCAAG